MTWLPSCWLWVSSVSEALLDVVGGGRRRVGIGFDAGDVVGHVPGALRRILGAAGDLLRGRALFLHGGRDRGGDLVDLADDAADALDGVDGFAATFWMSAICSEISSVAFAVWLASDFTSEATTAKPLPASPARAASMVALSASRLVCAAMPLIRPTTSPIRPAVSAGPARCRRSPGPD